jgi:transposase
MYKGVVFMHNLDGFISEFFPKKFIYTKHKLTNDTVELYFDLNSENETCPSCGMKARNFACYYSKKVQDLPILDRETNVIIRYKKMKCENANCDLGYFKQDMKEYVIGKTRYSNRLIEKARIVSLVMACEAGSRLLKEAKIKMSGDKLLQLAHESNVEIDRSKITKMGIDDFALKKNIDMELFL